MHARRKVHMLDLTRYYLMMHPDGLSDIDLQRLLQVPARSTAYRYRVEVGAVPAMNGWTYEPTLDDIRLALVILQNANPADIDRIESEFNNPV